jgi:hypothetical protein
MNGPVHAFVTWLATLLGFVTRFRRIRRDQLIAHDLAQLLAGDALHLDDTRLGLTPRAPPAHVARHSPKTYLSAPARLRVPALDLHERRAMLAA